MVEAYWKLEVRIRLVAKELLDAKFWYVRWGYFNPLGQMQSAAGGILLQL